MWTLVITLNQPWSSLFNLCAVFSLLQPRQCMILVHGILVFHLSTMASQYSGSPNAALTYDEMSFYSTIKSGLGKCFRRSWACRKTRLEKSCIGTFRIANVRGHGWQLERSARHSSLLYHALVPFRTRLQVPKAGIKKKGYRRMERFDRELDQ